MIEITPAEPKHVPQILSRFHVKNSPTLRVYTATENGSLLGCCGFESSGTNGEFMFSSVEGPGLEAIEDGLLRSALLLMFESGVKSVYCEGGVSTKMLVRLGFGEKEGIYKLDLGDSFLTKGCCAGGKK